MASTVATKLEAIDPTHRRRLKGPFHRHVGNMFVAELLWFGDHDENPRASRLKLYEDGRMLAPHQGHRAIEIGTGRYSHWRTKLRFSTSDGSDPNTNGRTYEFDFTLTEDDCERDRAQRHAARWRWHPEGERFLALGGEAVPPPLFANLGLTNKCNLRCEICGSQKHLDKTGVRRRHMPFETFEAVADTLFPVLAQVELNSQGDPLLHPRIEDILERIAANRCEVKIQHNGTLLSDRIIDLILEQTGTLMLSLDAVGSRFDEVRRGGIWSKAAGGLARLLRERDPARLTVGIYPTLTRRTVGDMRGIVDWAMAHRVDEVSIHRYVPIQDSWEEAPDSQHEAAMVEELRQWCVRHKDPLRVQFEGTLLNTRETQPQRTIFADAEKAAAVIESSKNMFPVEAGRPGADPDFTCAAPNEYVEIGLEGQVSACCRAQDVSLGRASSIDAFARSWFGPNYGAIRASLKRGAKGAYPLPNCASCVAFFAPCEARDRPAADYRAAQQPGELRLKPEQSDAFVVDGVQKEDGFCYIARFPLGIGAGPHALFEDGVMIGPGGSTHAAIRSEGRGRFHMGATDLYFSASDNSDPRRNGRLYSLKPVADQAKPAPAALPSVRSSVAEQAAGRGAA